MRGFFEEIFGLHRSINGDDWWQLLILGVLIILVAVIGNKIIKKRNKDKVANK